MQIKIQDLLPLLKPGFVAMDEDGSWCWYPDLPTRYIINWNGDVCEPLFAVFDIAKFDGDWKDSCMRCGQQSDKKPAVG